jgi:hypothetical protein
MVINPNSRLGFEARICKEGSPTVRDSNTTASESNGSFWGVDVASEKLRDGERTPAPWAVGARPSGLRSAPPTAARAYSLQFLRYGLRRRWRIERMLPMANSRFAEGSGTGDCERPLPGGLPKWVRQIV